MFEVSVSGRFAATHQLRLADGSLEPLHGHDWHVAVTVAGPRLDETGVLLDFTALRARLDEVLAALHERTLNELPAFADRNPSAESVAHYFAEQLAVDLPASAALTCVAVEEAPGCVARYRPRERNDVTT